MKLKKCPSCNSYTLKEICDECKMKTKDAHYKFVKIYRKIDGSGISKNVEPFKKEK